eukprot:gene40865-50274_t
MDLFHDAVQQEQVRLRSRLQHLMLAHLLRKIFLLHKLSPGYRDQVRAKTADFAELAKKYSEDGSAPNGGELGWMSPGDLVPEFEQAMNRLQIGEVLERREGQLTVEKQRQFARAAIRERKFDQAYQEWMRELRDNATVKILNVEDEA